VRLLTRIGTDVCTVVLYGQHLKTGDEKYCRDFEHLITYFHHCYITDQVTSCLSFKT